MESKFSPFKSLSWKGEEFLNLKGNVRFQICFMSQVDFDSD